MSEKFNHRYRVASARMQQWNYGWPGDYLVTIIAKDRYPYFGKVIANKGPGFKASVQLSQIGEVLAMEWYRTPLIRPDMDIDLGAFFIMPDHFHGIISIGSNIYNQPENDKNNRRDATHRVSPPTKSSSTSNTFSDHHGKPQSQNCFGPQSNNLASIMRGLKSAVTRQARKIDPNFAWQERFHERLIRDAVGYDRATYYILNNANEKR